MIWTQPAAILLPVLTNGIVSGLLNARAASAAFVQEEYIDPPCRGTAANPSAADIKPTAETAQFTD